MANGKTFHKVTNDDIFKEVQKLHTCVEDMRGQIKLNQWIATSALGVSVAAIGWIFKLARFV